MCLLLSPKWVVSHLFVATVAVVLACLGFWQLHRHEDRQSANARVRAAMSRPPVDVSGLTLAVEADSESGQTHASEPLLLDHTTVTATGIYMIAHEVLIGHRSYQGQPGMWLATPLRLREPGREEFQDGQVVLVVRGWIPRHSMSVGGVDAAIPPDGEVTVTGSAFASQEGGRVAVTGIGEKPELSKVDLDRFEEVTGLEVADMWIQLSEQSPPQAELLVPVPEPDLGNGPHMSYAGQWFFFCMGAVVVYTMILRRAVRGGVRS